MNNFYKHISFRYRHILIHLHNIQQTPLNQFPFKIHRSKSILNLSISTLLFTTRIDRNLHHRFPSIIHSSTNPIIPRGIFPFSPKCNVVPLPIFHPSRRVCIELRARFFEDGCGAFGWWLLEKAGLGRRPLFAARRGVVDCLSRFVFTRHDSADPDNKLPRSGCIKPGRKGETGEATVRRVEWESVNVVNRNKRGATRSFRLRKHKREEYAGSFINEVTVW